MMGHIQIHKKGYVASVDNLPLDKNLGEKQLEKVVEALENNTLPLFHKRIAQANKEILKKGDTAVLIVNNKQGSVNGVNLKVAGIVTAISGPGGRDGYFHIDDAKKYCVSKGQK